MKASRGICWYVFAIYATSVVVNYATHRHHLPSSISDWFQSTLEVLSGKSSRAPTSGTGSLIRCVLWADAGSESWIRDCEPLMKQMRKELVRTVESVARSPTVTAILHSMPISADTPQSKTSSFKSKSSTSKNSNKSKSGRPTVVNNAAVLASFVEQALKKVVSQNKLRSQNLNINVDHLDVLELWPERYARKTNNLSAGLLWSCLAGSWSAPFFWLLSGPVRRTYTRLRS